ncbi:MAG: tetratricopeptide repeat protein, partial [Acidobacteria bacterium]|nr:tetratricopeptide repeat protein [Acidobacteriota bacterium]
RWAAPGIGLGVVVVLLLGFVLGLNLGGVRDRLLGRPAAPEIDSLAVLPLENLSRDPEQDYFADGMTEALITELSKISALKVISRTSVMQYKGVKKPLPEIARELGVDAVVEGSVLRAGERVRITAQLIHGPTDKHLWADQYDREMHDVLSVHSEVARAIAREVRVAVTPAEEKRLAQARAVNPEAHEAYLKGRFHWNERTEEGLKKAIEYFQRAIEKDPGYAPAYAGLADAYLVLPTYGPSPPPPKEVLPKAEAAAQRALEIDENLAEAYTSLASIRQDYYDWTEAESYYRRAIELSPNYATAHHWYSMMLTQVGRHEEAIAEARRAEQLDPLSRAITYNVASQLYYARQYDACIAQMRKTIESHPDWSWGHQGLGMCYSAKGMSKEAIIELEKAVVLPGAAPVIRAFLARAYALEGRRNEARRILNEFITLSRQQYFPALGIAMVYVALGEKDQAFAWLGKAYEEKYDLGFLRADPAFDPLRDDPRYRELLRRMNFPE